MRTFLVFCFSILVLIIAMPSAGAQVTTAFTYQGKLEKSDGPATGEFDFEFRLYDSRNDGTVIAGPVTVENILVEDGLFATEVDFGSSAFGMMDVWLEVRVREGESTDGFTPLSPRQNIAPAPMAHHALNVEPDAVGGEQLRDGSVDSGTIEDFSIKGNDIDSTEIQKRVDTLCSEGAWFSGIQATGTAFCSRLPGNSGFGGLSLTGSLSSGSIPTEGAGVRLMWYPGKAAFRAGEVDGSQWDDVNVGSHSIAAGQNPVASGPHAVALGEDVSASDQSAVALGRRALADGFSAVAIGEGEAGDRNTVAIGTSAEATFERATALGFGARATAFEAVALGNASAEGPRAVAMGNITTASGNNATAMGLGTSAQGANSLAAGRNAKAVHDGTFVWGDDDTSNFESTAANQFLIRAGGGAGINTSNPLGAFHVRGASPSSIFNGQVHIEGDETTGDAGTGGALVFRGHDGDGVGRVWGATRNVKENATLGNADSVMRFYTRQNGSSLQERFRIDSDGNTFNSDGTWSTLSDLRLKKDIGQIERPLDRLLSLRGVGFHYRDNEQVLAADGPRMGFIAQEVESVFPEWVGESADGYKYVAPAGFRALVVEALRQFKTESGRNDNQVREQLARKLSAQKALIRQLEGRLAELQSAQHSRIEELEHQLTELSRLVSGRADDSSVAAAQASH